MMVNLYFNGFIIILQHYISVFITTTITKQPNQAGIAIPFQYREYKCFYIHYFHTLLLLRKDSKQIWGEYPNQ